MSKVIENSTYTGFIDYDRPQLTTATTTAKIEWLEYRIHKTLIDPLDQILPCGSQCHDTINLNDRTFNLCGVTLVACAIEALGHFLTGSGDAGRSFKLWVESYMQDWNKKTVNGVLIRNWLWDSARNGMAHQLSFKSGGTEVNNGSRFTVGQDGQIQMDPFLFYDDFKTGVKRYLADLLTDPKLQQEFNRRFKNSLLNS